MSLKLGFMMAAVGCASVPSLALANDTGFAAIKVQNLSKTATGFEIKGKEAKKLMAILPKVSSAGGPEYEKHSHALYLESPHSSLMIGCDDATWDLKPLPEGVNCYIHFEPSKYTDIETFNFDPRVDPGIQ